MPRSKRIPFGAGVSGPILAAAMLGAPALRSADGDAPVPAARAPAPPARADVPAARAHHRLVSLPDGGVLLIGGSTRRQGGYLWFDDTWAWGDGAWARGASLPWRRSSHAVAWDGARDALVLLGGIGGPGDVAEGTVQVRAGGRWERGTELPDEGWAEPAACYDRRRERVVIFGGWDRDDAYRGDTWEWDGRALERADEGGHGPAARAGHEMAFDPVRGRCILFGGRGTDGLLADTWEWDGEAWRPIGDGGPPPRWFFGMTTADAWDRVVLFGGAGEDGNLGDTWRWDGAAWSRVQTRGPPARGMSRIAFDGERVVLFGGRRARGDRPFVDLNDTWLFDGESWREVEPDPRGRRSAETAQSSGNAS